MLNSWVGEGFTGVIHIVLWDTETTGLIEDDQPLPSIVEIAGQTLDSSVCVCVCVYVHVCTYMWTPLWKLRASGVALFRISASKYEKVSTISLGQQI